MANFKVIVIGAGPVGLVAANFLSKAGIDFVVLEGRPEVLRDVGASLVLGAESMRVLYQVGMLDKLRAKGTEVHRWISYTLGGVEFNGGPIGDRGRTDFGSAAIMFHRAELLQILYENLSKEDLARVHVNKKLTAIEETDDGVVVSCEDGSKYEGSMVLGADGVHSKTRSIMREKILKTDPEADVDDLVPFPVEYKTLWCSFPRQWSFAAGDHLITHGDTASLQFLNAIDRSWVFCYEKLESPPKGRVKYSDEDMMAYVEKHGDMLIGGRLKLRDLFAQRRTGAMANLEEGMLKNWSTGRVALAGDACHKFTPNAGLGLNTGIQDVTALVNELHRLAEATGGAAPSREELTTVFKRYHEMRKEAVEAHLAMSGHVTRLHAWPNSIYWLMNRYVMPNIPGFDKMMWDKVMAPKLRKSYCLDFVGGEEPFQGRIPWEYPIKPATKMVA